MRYEGCDVAASDGRATQSPSMPTAPADSTRRGPGRHRAMCCDANQPDAPLAGDVQAPTNSRQRQMFWPLALLGCLFAIWLARDLLRDSLLRRSGYALSIKPPVQAIVVPRGGVARVSVVAHNLLDQSVTIHGMATDCGCLSSSSMPLTIPARGNANLNFSVAASKSNSTDVAKRAKLFLNVSSLPVMVEIRAKPPR